MDKWIKKFNNLIDSTADSLLDNCENITEADIGLILRVLEDSLDEKDDSVDRGIRTLEIAKCILNQKYNQNDLSWFDIYTTVLTANTRYKRNESGDSTDIDCELDDAYKKTNIRSNHTDEFQISIERILEALRSEKGRELIQNTPDETDIDTFKSMINMKSSSMYGSVEIPNNASRMNCASKILKLYKDLSEDDFIWCMNRLETWLMTYARAEATIANRNIERDDLREFMQDEMTPAEKYF